MWPRLYFMRLGHLFVSAHSGNVLDCRGAIATLRRHLKRRMTKFGRWEWLVALILSGWMGTCLAQPDNDSASSFNGRLLGAFQGDLPEMRQRRLIRVLVNPSRTNFFFEGDRIRGIEYELLSRYEKFLNRGPRKQRYRVHLIFLPTPFSAVLDGVINGKGDIGAAGLTITPERANLVAFTKPYLRDINEVLVTATDAPQPQQLEDLSDKTIVVVRHSSYAAHLQLFNLALGRIGLQPMEIVQADPTLEAEDILELVNEGLVDYTVVDSHIAGLWQKVLPNIRVRDDFIFHYGGKIAWAVRKKNPRLLHSLNDFIDRYARPGKLLSNILYKRYFESTRWLNQDFKRKALLRFQCYKPWLMTLADFFDFNWHLLAAVAYTESHLNPRKKSHAGAIGLMQIKPVIARQFGIRDLYDPHDNLLAGSAYLAWLRDIYFDEPDYTPEARINFVLAAYNAGPTRIRRLQEEAKARGLDPHKWFYNVEIVARQRIGHETVNYVARVRKTETALRLMDALQQRQRRVKQNLMAQQGDTPARFQSPASAGAAHATD